MNSKVSSPRAAGARFAKRRSYGRRRGYVLVLVIMLLFGILGLAALVIDIGFARLAQSEMQTAADSAALEGLRWRDVTQSGDLPQAWLANPDFQQQTGVLSSTGTLSSLQADRVRRWAASNSVANTFADSVDSSGGTVQYGAGPVVNFSPGVGDPSLAAGQTIEQPGSAGNPSVYQPRRSDGTPGLELNYLDNARNGDMTSGTYGVMDPNFDATSTADEDTNYYRRDFTPPSGGTAAASAPAFLVRMRRTSDTSGIDNKPDVSSGGSVGLPDGNYNTIPYLFGRGSMINKDPASSYSPRQKGITIRATAIAAVGPVTFATSGGTYSAGLAKTVGPAYWIPPSVSNPGTTMLFGLAPFALRSDFWRSLTGGTVATVDLKTTSQVLVLNPLPDTTYNTYAAMHSPPLPLHYVASAAAIGQPAAVEAVFSDVGLSQAQGNALYVPIFTNYSLGGQTYTVIGFGYLPASQWTYSPATATLDAKITFNTPAASPAPQIGNQNLSAQLGVAIPASFSQQDVADLFQLHENSVTDPNLTGYMPLVNPIYAPVLVDHYIGPNTP